MKLKDNFKGSFKYNFKDNIKDNFRGNFKDNFKDNFIKDNLIQTRAGPQWAGYRWPKDWVLLQFIWPHIGYVLQHEFVNIEGVLL